jgi:2-polyprenyl-3-methyl-5-hydroxy-6-metoxy-1,4-benzoquinol methylase
MNPKPSYGRISFEDFQQRARDGSLSKYEKIGFPDDYRENKEINIFKDLVYKLKLDRANIRILDIGCGCSDLVDFFIQNSIDRNQKLILMDSSEMLSLIKAPLKVQRILGKFPDDFHLLEANNNNLDVIVAYSVMQHVILDSNPFSFIDKALELLKPTGALLLGDIPNNSKRNRYFASERGIKAHQNYVQSTEIAPPIVNYPETFEKIDDGIVLGILMRYRSLGFETYLLPQNDDLPMANRREDILIVKN